MRRVASIAGRLLATAGVLSAAALLARFIPFGAVEAADTAAAVPPASPAVSAPAAPLRQGAPLPCSGAAPCPGSPEEVLAGFGLAGFSLTPAGGAPRTGPVPPVPGAVEVARHRQAGLTLVLDRPADPDLAPELAAVALLEAGWLPAVIPDDTSLHLPETGGRTFVRGAEVAVVALEALDPGDPLLLIVHHRGATPPENVP